MENPNTWGPVEKLVNKTIEEWEYLMGIGVCGLSLEAMIAHNLKTEGLLKDEDDRT